MKIVCDTNVLISGLWSPFGPPGKLIDLLRVGHLTLCVDDRIYGEYQEVLQRPRFASRITAAERGLILDFIQSESEWVLCHEFLNHLPDPDDAPFAEVALLCDVPLVTGNEKHYPTAQCQALKVCSPADFLNKVSGA